MSLQYRLTNLLSRIHSSTILAKLVKGASLVFLIQGLGMGLSYFTQILFVRWMGLKEFGNYTYALTWFQVLVVISMFGLDSGMVRFIPEYMAQHDWGNLKGLSIDSLIGPYRDKYSDHPWNERNCRSVCSHFVSTAFTSDWHRLPTTKSV